MSRSQMDRKGRLLPKPLLLFLPLLLLSSCFSYEEVELREVTKVAVERFDAAGIFIRVDARLSNPNAYKIHVLDPDVELYLNDKYIGKGFLDSAIVLDKRRERVYSVPMHAKVEAGPLLMMVLSGALSGKEMKLGIKGTVVGKALFLRKRIPFELEERISL